MEDARNRLSRGLRCVWLVHGPSSEPWQVRGTETVKVFSKTSRLSGVLPHTKYVSTLHRILRGLVVHRILKDPSGITRSGSFDIVNSSRIFARGPRGARSVPGFHYTRAPLPSLRPVVAAPQLPPGSSCRAATRGAACRGAFGLRNPFRVEISGTSRPRVAPLVATPGFVAKSLWDWGRRWRTPHACAKSLWIF
jgi:hypothetical protein